MQNKINLGIIGKNFGYHVIYKSFLKNKKYKIKGFCYKSKKKEKIKILKGVKIYSDWRELILDKKINAIAVATPPSTHKHIISFAIKNNKHIFCEKPLTRSYQEASTICNLIRRKKNLSHIVNYEFGEINAFYFFKKKIINKIKINRVDLNWFININKRSNSHWKENHLKGGGIIYNYFCHSIYYLEFLFGKIISVQSNISIKAKNKIKYLQGIFFFSNGISVLFNMKVGNILKKIKPIHQLKILTNRKTYILETNLNSLSDKFTINVLNNLTNQQEKISFKDEKNKNDFRITPTFYNSKKFSNWILKGKIKKPNFFDGKRIHLIINKMMISSKKRKKININS